MLMKRLLISAAMFLCCVATSFAQFSGSGSGTESDPYLILNPIQLNQMRNFLNQSGVYFKLMADIDLTEFLGDESPSQGWQPIGTSSAPFKGILDGNDKTVSGLWINRPNSDYAGIFGGTDGATINNLKIVATTIVGKDNVGGMSGYSKSSYFSGCSFKGEIQGRNSVGGYIGSSRNNITLFENLAEITITGSGDYVGGFIGKGIGGVSVSNCKILEAKIQGGNYVGGICGASSSGNNNYSSCYVNSNIHGVDYVGGICGQTRDNTNNITNCGFIGDITANSIVGGIAGEYTGGASYSYRNGYNSTEPTLKNCFSVSNIIAQGDNVGGLVGITDNRGTSYSGTLQNTYNVFETNIIGFSYFSGNVKGSHYVGGIVGYKKGGGIKSCYSKGNIYGEMYVGGICGEIVSFGTAEIKSNLANISSIKSNLGNVGRICYKDNYLGELGTSNENKALNRCIVISKGISQEVNDDKQNGTGVGATSLKLKATYVAMGWDFTDIWEIQETECYPYFKWQTAPPVITSQVVSEATTVSGKCVNGGLVTLEIDGLKQQMVGIGHDFSFTVSPLQAGHEVRVSAKVDGKEQSYYTTETVSYLGKGTESDPYLVYTAADLTQVYRKGYYKLMNDIDLTSYINQFSPTEGWQSIGRDGSEAIHFDGDGHKITGLWCNSTRDNTGLFSCFANGTIKNLTVETAQGKQVKGGSNTGILIGKMMSGTIENCHVSGTVADGTPVGGMVGLFDGGTISRCYANVTINTTLATSYVGGLVGEISDGKIDQCVVTGSLIATGSESYVGGLIGKNYATVTNCYSFASAHSSFSAAGLVAYNYNVVNKCYAMGNLFSDNYAAGVISYNDGSNAVIKNCVAMNRKIDVTYESQSAQGGGYGQRIIGGIKNGAPAPEMNNYALNTMQVSVNDVPQKVYDDIMNGVGKEKIELIKKEAYEQLGWDFTNIWDVETGLGTPYLRNVGKINSVFDEPDDDDPVEEDTDNTLTLGQVSAHKGQQAVLPIVLTNKNSITGLQFDLYLPDGVSVATNSRGKMIITTTSRMDGNYSISSSQMDGFIRVLGYSADGDAFSGNDGDILNVTLNIGENVADGDYTIRIKDIVLSDVNNTEYHPADAEATLTVKNYTLGDVDNSGAININDVVCIINYILNKANGTFIENAADVDGSGSININDVVTLINRFILHRGNAPIHRAPRLAPITDTNYLHLATIDLKPGETKEVEMILTNDNTVSAAQGNIKLPEGLSFVTKSNGRVDATNINDRSEDFTLSCAIQNDGSMTFAHYSADGYTYEGNEGGIFTFKVKADENAVAGSYSVNLTGVVLSINGVGYDIADRTSTLTIGGTTGINSIGNGELKIDNWYSVDGKKLNGEPTKPGIYIKNRKKVVK